MIVSVIAAIIIWRCS